VPVLDGFVNGQPIEQQPERESYRERLAISLVDIPRVDPALLSGRLDMTTLVRAGNSREGDPSVMFSCELLLAAVICDLIRSRNRETGEPTIGIYVCRAGEVWQRARDRDVFTVPGLTGGPRRLNPEFFRSVEPERAIGTLARKGPVRL
jgi:hypothetical protein